MITKPASFLQSSIQIRPLRKIDAPTLAAAYRAKSQRRSGTPKARPTVPAITPGPCGFCGIRGWLGCDHFLPFEPPVVARKASPQRSVADTKGAN